MLPVKQGLKFSSNKLPPDKSKPGRLLTPASVATPLLQNSDSGFAQAGSRYKLKPKPLTPVADGQDLLVAITMVAHNRRPSSLQLVAWNAAEIS